MRKTYRWQISFSSIGRTSSDTLRSNVNGTALRRYDGPVADAGTRQLNNTNLNSTNPNNAEGRKKKRQLLETETLGTIRSYLRDELSAIAPPELSTETMEQLVEAKIAESQRIIDALTTSELENAFAMQRHAEKAVAEIRSDVYRRIERR